MTTQPTCLPEEPPMRKSETELVPASDPRATLISIDRERVSGTPCFVGTRVPIQSLWDYLAGGDSLEEFLEDFPGVSREQAVAVIQMAAERLMEGLPAA